MWSCACVGMCMCAYACACACACTVKRVRCIQVKCSGTCAEQAPRWYVHGHDDRPTTMCVPVQVHLFHGPPPPPRARARRMHMPTPTFPRAISAISCVYMFVFPVSDSLAGVLVWIILFCHRFREEIPHRAHIRHHLGQRPLVTVLRRYHAPGPHPAPFGSVARILGCCSRQCGHSGRLPDWCQIGVRLSGHRAKAGCVCARLPVWLCACNLNRLID